MSGNAFAARQRAAEGHYFNTEDRLAIMRHLERLVESVSLSPIFGIFPCGFGDRTSKLPTHHNDASCLLIHPHI